MLAAPTHTMADTPQAAATAATATAAAAHATPPELEQTLTLLTSHRSVLGYMLLSRSQQQQPVTIIRHSGVVFEGEQGRKYASAIARIVHSVQTGLEDVSSGQSDTVRLQLLLCAFFGFFLVRLGCVFLLSLLLLSSNARFGRGFPGGVLRLSCFLQ